MKHNQRKNIYLFPALPGENSGYSKVVKSDLEALKVSSQDYVVFISDKPIKSKKSNEIYFYRNNIFFRLLNIFTHAHPSIFNGLYLYLIIKLKFRQNKFDTVFVGDANYYYLSKYFEANNTIFRLHNLYLKIKFTLVNKNLYYKDIRMMWECFTFIKVENKILNSCSKKKKTNFIYFISDEEKYFCIKQYERKINSKTLKYKFEGINYSYKITDNIWDKRIIWFGGLSSHKILGIKIFIGKVFLSLLEYDKNIKFELFGKGTNRFDKRESNIYGHGYVNEFDYYDYKNSLFINPDIMGGGIKIKLYDIYKYNLRCLTTPEGIEGFDSINQWSNLKIEEIDKWKRIIIENFLR